MSATVRSTQPDAAAVAVFAQLVPALLAGSTGGDLAGAYGALKDRVRALARRDPFDSVMATVLGASVLFYLAEKDENPKVRSPVDALVFVTTCLSVGYADTFARTPSGKAIASFVMTVGPALSSTMFDAPEPAVDPVVARLDAILAALTKG